MAYWIRLTRTGLSRRWYQRHTNILIRLEGEVGWKGWWILKSG